MRIGQEVEFDDGKAQACLVCLQARVHMCLHTRLRSINAYMREGLPGTGKSDSPLSERRGCNAHLFFNHRAFIRRFSGSTPSYFEPPDCECGTLPYGKPIHTNTTWCQHRFGVAYAVMAHVAMAHIVLADTTSSPSLRWCDGAAITIWAITI